MPERLLQSRFSQQFDSIPDQDVTPADFTGLPPLLSFPNTPSILLRQSLESDRFIREARQPVAVTCPADAAKYLQANIYHPFTACDQEELWALLLNTKNIITHESMVYRGTINQIAVRPAELYKDAVRVNAAALIISHNHPSGKPTPSPEDIHVTRQAVEVGQLLGIELLDHIIVGLDRWVSLKERNLRF
jgi:DNA repair protein RadC